MHPQHIETFFAAAQKLSCCIALREPNHLSDKYIGKPGYIAKEAICKAKTANNPAFRFAGLVVSPVLCTEAFKDSRQAETKWAKFAPGNKLKAGFTCPDSGSEKGLVRYNGNAIHADYDLLAVIKAGKEGALEFTSEESGTALFLKVEKYLNDNLNTKMIQHGTEFMWDGIGAEKEEFILYFGPNRTRKRPDIHISHLHARGTIH